MYPKFICHKLNVDPKCNPKKEKPRRSSDIHFDTVKEKVDNLKGARTIKEVFYPNWLAKTGKLSICMDFTDLNKACPKDPFSIPKIDQPLNTTFGHSRMSFLNAFQGYH